MRVLLKITDIIDVGHCKGSRILFQMPPDLLRLQLIKGNPITEYSNFSEYCNCVRKDSNNRDCCYQSDPMAALNQHDPGNHRFTFVMEGWLIWLFQLW